MAMGPDEKKKAIFFGGLAAAIGLAALAVMQPWAGRTSGTADTAGTTPGSTTTVAGGVPGAPETPPVAGGAGGAAPVAAGGVTGGAVAGRGGAALVAAERYRDDPFLQYYNIPPTPLPTLPPPPTPTPIPPPLRIEPPGEFAQGYPRAQELPSFPGGNTRSTVLAGLPTARISRLVNAPTAPRLTSPPSTPGSSGTNTTVERSPGKRLAGVAIGDSVRALLEVEDPTTGEFRTYIVQPGQRVDAENLQVLRIERSTEGSQTRVRMIVRERGEVRVIELREGARPDLVTGGLGGEGGLSGSGSGGPGGFPGGGFPGGFPGGGVLPGGGRGLSSGGASGGFPGGNFPGAAAPPGFPGGRPGFGGAVQ